MNRDYPLEKVQNVGDYASLRTHGSQRSLRSLLSSTGKILFPDPLLYFVLLTNQL